MPNTHSVLFRKNLELLDRAWDSVLWPYASYYSSLNMTLSVCPFLLSFPHPSLSTSFNKYLLNLYSRLGTLIGSSCLYALFPQSNSPAHTPEYIRLLPMGLKVTQPGIESNSLALGKLLNHSSAKIAFITWKWSLHIYFLGVWWMLNEIIHARHPLVTQ